MQIKHSLKRHLVGACILGAVALLAFSGGSDAPGKGGTPAARAGHAAATPPRAGGQDAAAALDRLAAMTLVTSGARPHARTDTALAAAPAAPVPAPAQAAQRTVIQTERQVAALRRQGGDENAVYRLRSSILPAALVASLMERESAEARWRTASHGAAAPPPAPPPLKQD